MRNCRYLDHIFLEPLNLFCTRWVYFHWHIKYSVWCHHRWLNTINTLYIPKCKKCKSCLRDWRISINCWIPGKHAFKRKQDWPASTLSDARLPFGNKLSRRSTSHLHCKIKVIKARGASSRFPIYIVKMFANAVESTLIILDFARGCGKKACLKSSEFFSFSRRKRESIGKFLDQS